MGREHPSSQLLQQWIDGELSARETDLVTAHVQFCRDCQQRAAAMGKLKDVVKCKTRQLHTPAGLEHRVRERLVCARLETQQESSAESDSPRDDRPRELGDTQTLRQPAHRFVRRAALLSVAWVLLLATPGLYTHMANSSPTTAKTTLPLLAYAHHCRLHGNLGAPECGEGSYTGMCEQLSEQRLCAEPPRFARKQVRLSCSRPVTLGSHAGVHVAYEIDGHSQLSWYLLPTGSPPSSESLHHRALLRSCDTIGEHQVLCCTYRGLLHVFVTDLERSQLSQLLLSGPFEGSRLRIPGN